MFYSCSSSYKTELKIFCEELVRFLIKKNDDLDDIYVKDKYIYYNTIEISSKDYKMNFLYKFFEIKLLTSDNDS